MGKCEQQLSLEANVGVTSSSELKGDFQGNKRVKVEPAMKWYCCTVPCHAQIPVRPETMTYKESIYRDPLPLPEDADLTADFALHVRSDLTLNTALV